MTRLELLDEVRGCRLCADKLPFEPRPVLQWHPAARILIAAQAPGRKVHDTGIPFNDASGERLRFWMGISRQIFYDEQHIAILPMGFCYPGTGKSGDLPPRPECAPAWREALLSQLNDVQLTMVIGQYAQADHFSNSTTTLTQKVMNWRESWPSLVPLPHPSPRNRWLKQNPWFEEVLVPKLRRRVKEVLSGSEARR